jgi:hypothetical protein
MPVFEREKEFHALDRTATVTGIEEISSINMQMFKRGYRLIGGTVRT